MIILSKKINQYMKISKANLKMTPLYSYLMIVRSSKRVLLTAKHMLTYRMKAFLNNACCYTQCDNWVSKQLYRWSKVLPFARCGERGRTQKQHGQLVVNIHTCISSGIDMPITNMSSNTGDRGTFWTSNRTLPQVTSQEQHSTSSLNLHIQMMWSQSWCCCLFIGNN